jgi:four helix bundle suffix protein
MEIKLANVNRASLHELLLDYEDYLRVRELEQWKLNDPRAVKTRAFCKAHLDSAIYREKIRERSDETIANIAITLIHQCDVLLRGMIEWMKRDFIENGGIKEEMYRARKDWQRRNGYNGGDGFNGFDGANRSNGSNGPSQPNQPIRPIEPIKPKKD